jgi:hypothetical protein
MNYNNNEYYIRDLTGERIIYMCNVCKITFKNRRHLTGKTHNIKKEIWKGDQYLLGDNERISYSKYSKCNIIEYIKPPPVEEEEWFKKMMDIYINHSD